MNISLSAFAPENLVSRDGFGSPVRVSLLICILRLNLVFTRGIPPEFRGGARLFILNHHTPSGQSRVYRVTQLRNNGVHYRESAGTGSVNLKVAPNECCLGRSRGPINMRLYSSHPLMIWSWHVESTGDCFFFVSIDFSHKLMSIIQPVVTR